MKYLMALVLALALSGPAWADPGGPEGDGCYTDRKWRRHCPEAAGQTRAAVRPAKARAKERDPGYLQGHERGQGPGENRGGQGRALNDEAGVTGDYEKGSQKTGR